MLNSAQTRSGKGFCPFFKVFEDFDVAPLVRAATERAAEDGEDDGEEDFTFGDRSGSEEETEPAGPAGAKKRRRSPTPPPPSPPPPLVQPKTSRSHQKRKQKRAAKREELGHQPSAHAVKTVRTNAPAIQVDFDTGSLPAANGAYSGKNIKHENPRKRVTPSDFSGLGISELEVPEG